MKKSKAKNYEKMIEKRSVFDTRKTDLSLVGADTVNPLFEGTNLDCLILLNKHNSKIVEDAIKKNYLYINYVEMVCDTLKARNGGQFPEKDERSVLALVKIIDYENSTDVWVHCRESFIKMVKYITNPNGDFWPRLKKGEIDLVDDLTNASVGKTKRMTKNGVKVVEAKFESLASKICKYFAEYILGKDFYYINDKFVNKVLPFYYYYYFGQNISVQNISYGDLFKYIEKIHNEVSKTDVLTKSELDHLMWYCYKSSIDIYHL